MLRYIYSNNINSKPFFIDLHEQINDPNNSLLQVKQTTHRFYLHLFHRLNPTSRGRIEHSHIFAIVRGSILVPLLPSTPFFLRMLRTDLFHLVFGCPLYRVYCGFQSTRLFSRYLATGRLTVCLSTFAASFVQK